MKYKYSCADVTFYNLKNLLEMGMLLKLNHGETIKQRKKLVLVYRK